MIAVGQNDAKLWKRRTLGLLLVLGLLRLGYLAVLPLELCADEAYYWDWSRQLDYGYYSKPPLIAWIMAAAVAVGGSSEFSLRVPAALFSTFGLWPVYALAARMFDPRTGFWSVVAVAATPGIAAMSFLMTIDAPFLACWATAVWCAWELLSPDKPARRWLLPAIVATGLGLLAKQTMLAIIPLTGLWLLSSPRERGKLKSPLVWSWWSGSLLFLTPVLVWNARHDWITVQHTREHFQNRPVESIQHLRWFLEFWASQFGILSPVSCGIMLGLTIAGLLGWRTQDARIRYLLCLGAVPMVGVTVLATQQRVQPNWPAAFVLTSFILLAAWGRGRLPDSATTNGRLWRRRCFDLAWGCGALMAVGVVLIPFVIPGSELAGGPFDPTARLRGYRPLGRELQAYIERETREGRPLLVIATTGRGPVSLLAYYTPSQPRVYRWNPTGIVESQHEIWGGPHGEHSGERALIISVPNQPLPSPIAAAFSRTELLGRLESSLGGGRVEAFDVWVGEGYRGWPSLPPTRANAP